MNTWRSTDKQFASSFESEHLNFFRTECRYANFADPDRQICYGIDFSKLVWPFMDCPMVPIERKSVHRDGIDVAQNTLLL